MDYSAWKLEDLQAEFVRLGHEYAAIGTARSEMWKELEFRRQQAVAVMRLTAMPEQFKDALRVELAKAK